MVGMLEFITVCVCARACVRSRRGENLSRTVSFSLEQAVIMVANICWIVK
jgi:hypothetical protein